MRYTIVSWLFCYGIRRDALGFTVHSYTFFDIITICAVDGFAHSKKILMGTQKNKLIFQIRSTSIVISPRYWNKTSWIPWRELKK